MTRRAFAVVVGLFALLILPKDLFAGLPGGQETLLYDVHLLNLVKALEVKIVFEPEQEKNTFHATLFVQPVGIFKILAPYKSCEFISKLRLVPETGRIRPESFEKRVKSKHDYRGVYQFDYERGVVTGQGFWDERPLAIETFPMPDKPGIYYDDFLSFLYNFRTGAYGTLKPGEIVYIHAIPTRNKGIFEMEVISPQREKLSSKVSASTSASHLMAVKLNKEFLGFQVDQFFLWLTDDYLPVEGLVKDVVGWGDIVGALRIQKEPS